MYSEDAGFITFLGKFGIALMYAGLAVVVLGMLRLIWSKRSFLRSSSRIRGPISLPHGTPNSGNEALPFIRPDTPGGSRPSTPFDGSPSRHEQSNRPGLLYYLPVWVMPPSERPGGGGQTPNGADSNWSQYFSNLSFVDTPDQANRYHPIPSFSRPPSPSNNSILHAPGATHDGAFDGVQLHSIQQPQPTRPQNSSVSTSSNSPLPPSTSGPNSPPAYSTLRSVGASLFRPFHSINSKESGEIFHSEHSSTTFDQQQQQQQHSELSESKLFSSGSTATTSSGDRSSTSNLRPRSPNFSIPPQYTSSQPGSTHHSRSTTPTPQSSSTSKPSSQAEYGTEFGRSSQVEETGRNFEFESYGDSIGDEAATYDERVLGIPLEEEVDRLLNEMSPDSIDLEKGATTARKA